MNIAIDGPAGAGKSTIAKLAAAKLGFVYVDTGAMYRSIALYVIRHNVDPDNDEDMTNALDEIDINLSYEEGTQHIFLNSEDVSSAIRQEQVGNMASKVATKPAVRAKLLDLQRGLAKKQDVIMDGRDIGSFVLPDAELKIYLTASADERAKRRYNELVSKGQTPELEQIKQDIIARDYQDMNREIAPLVQAEDAVLIDSSDMTIDEVADRIITLCRQSVTEA